MTGESTVFGATIFKYFDSKCNKRITTNHCQKSIQAENSNRLITEWQKDVWAIIIPSLFDSIAMTWIS
jgi:hypothetical protein